MSRGPLAYLAAAFNARPFGMAIAPNWFALAAFGLLGAFVSPGFWLIGAGLEAAYLWVLATSSRFRAVVDAMSLSSGGSEDWGAQYRALVARLDERSRAQQNDMERQGAALVEVLTRAGAFAAQLTDVRQLVWLHLKLLAARSALREVIGLGSSEQTALDEQRTQLKARLEKPDLDAELRSSLAGQMQVIESRQQAHTVASKRCEFVDAEIDRLRQQLSLVREQALLATDEGSVARSVDALSASLNEANRWLKDQRELFAGFESFADDPPPPELLGAAGPTSSSASPASSPSSSSGRRSRTKGVSE